MTRVTEKQLEAIAKRINSILGTPSECYTHHADGSFTPNADCYFISYAYGGAQLQKMSSKPGCTGVDFTLPSGHVPKRELMEAMQGFISGLYAKKGD